MDSPKAFGVVVDSERVGEIARYVMDQLADAGIGPNVDTFVALAYAIVCQIRRLEPDRTLMTVNMASVIAIAMALLPDDPDMNDVIIHKIAKTH